MSKKNQKTVSVTPREVVRLESVEVEEDGRMEALVVDGKGKSKYVEIRPASAEVAACLLSAASDIVSAQLLDMEEERDEALNESYDLEQERDDLEEEVSNLREELEELKEADEERTSIPMTGYAGASSPEQLLNGQAKTVSPQMSKRQKVARAAKKAKK